MKRISIENSLSRWLALQTFIALSSVCVVIYATMAWSIRSKQFEELQQHDAMVRHAVMEDGSSNSAERIREKLKSVFSSHSNFAIEVQANGVTIYSQIPSPNQQARWRWVDSPSDPELTINGKSVRTRLAVDVTQDEGLKRQLAWTLMATVVLGSLLVSLSGALLVRLGLTPLRRLAKETGAAGPSHPGRRLHASSYASELQPWIAQFNALLQRADTAYSQLEKFNASLAQELKAPLLSMVDEIERELRSRNSIESLQDALGSCLEGVQRMSFIMNDMLFLSQAERGVKALRSKPEQLAKLVRLVAEFHESELEERRVTFTISGDAVIAVDQSLVRRALSILVANALRTSLPNQVITCVIAPNTHGVSVSLEGRAMASAPALAASAVTDARLLDAEAGHDGRSRDLGMAIVAAIARMHGGSAFATRNATMFVTGLFLAHASTDDVERLTAPRSQRLGRAPVASAFEDCV